MSEKNMKAIRKANRAEIRANHKHLVSDIIRWKSVIKK